MIRQAVIPILLCCIGAPASPAQSPEASAPRGSAAAHAALARLIDQADPSLRSARPPAALTEIETPPPDTVAVLAALDVQAATVESCSRIVDAVEAWADWGERIAESRMVLVGWPDSDHRLGARVASRSVAALAAVARVAIDRAIDRADRAAPTGGAPEQDESLLPLLHARQVTLPLRAARAADILAAAEPRREQRSALARAAIAMAQSAEPVSEWAESERFLVLGHAALAEGSPASALESFASARQAVSGRGVAPRLFTEVAAEAALGAALALAAARGPLTARDSLDQALARPPFLVDGARPEPRLELLAAQTQLRLGRLIGEALREEPPRRAALDFAFACFSELLDRAPDGIDPIVWRSHVYRRLAPGVEADDPRKTLAPVALVARAVSTAPSDLASAIADLRESLYRDPAPSRVVVADASLELALLHARSESPESLEASVTGFERFVEQFPDDPRAPGALSLACAAAVRLIGARPGSLDFYLRALRRAAASQLRFPEQDAWRLALIDVLVRTAQSQPPTLEGVRAAAEAAREADLVASLMEESEPARRARVATALCWSASLVALQSDPALEPPEKMSVRAQADSLLSAAAEAARHVDPVAHPRDHAQIQFAIAQARLSLGQDPRAAAESLLATLGSRAPSAPDEDPVPDAARALLLGCLATGQSEFAALAAQRLESRAAGEGARLVRLYADHAWRQIEPLTLGPRDWSPPAPGDRARYELLLTRIDTAVRLNPDNSDDRIRRGWAHLSLHDAPSAARDFDQVLSAEPGWRSARLGLAEALMLTGDDAGAFSRFRDLAAALEAAGERSADYFHCWTRMLEILQHQNRDGSRTQTIRRECRRLLLSPELRLCPPCRERLTALERLSGEPGR